MEPQQPMRLEPVSAETRTAILGNFVEVPNAKAVSEFCVDGRTGSRKDSSGTALEGPYMQALGGSFHLSALRWILGNGQPQYTEVITQTFNDLKNKGYRVSAHTGHHGDGETKSDCGFDDNFAKIVSVLASESDAIWKSIVEAVPSLEAEKEVWDDILMSVHKSTTHLEEIPSGHKMVMEIAKDQHGADMQELDGEHGEVAAVVNLKRGTTLDVDKNQATPAFNLDLWHILDQAEALGIDKAKAKLLSLGLYVATEKVLVEQKKGYAIPIIINE